MQRDGEQVAQPSPATTEPAPDTDADASLSWQNRTLLPAREKGAGIRQLQRLAEELRVLWQDVAPQQAWDPEWLHWAQLPGRAGGPMEGDAGDAVESVWRGAPRPPRAKKHKADLREAKPPKPRSWHPKSQKKSLGSEKLQCPPSPGLPEKNKGKRAPANRSNSSRRSGDPRGSRGLTRERPHLVLTPVGEFWHQEEGEKGLAREGRRQPGRGSTCQESSCHGPSAAAKTTDVAQLGPADTTCESEAAAEPQALPCGHGAKNRCQRELQCALEALSLTNQKLKEHLSLHLEPRRPEVDQDPGSAEQGFSELPESPAGQERTVPTEAVPAGESSPVLFQTNKSHPTAKPAAAQDESQTSAPGVDPEPGPPAPPADNCAHLHLPEQTDRGGWPALRQRLKSDTEQRRQKALLGQTKHPDMSLEIHYMAELEEERRERRRALLAHLKSSPSSASAKEKERRVPSPLDSSVLDEELQSQLIRDLQQQILEQSKLHKQFLDQARKRLQEFQKVC